MHVNCCWLIEKRDGIDFHQRGGILRKFDSVSSPFCGIRSAGKNQPDLTVIVIEAKAIVIETEATST